MKLRRVIIFTGQVFNVPEGIQRIDTRYTHGWQVRYNGKTKMFSDHSNDGSGAVQSLELATLGLARRIARQPAPAGLQRQPSVSKTSDMPVGISGPLYRLRPGSQVREINLSVSIPRFGDKPLRRSVYVGNDNTVTPARLAQALEKAIEMRSRAERAYRLAATRAKRLAGRDLLAP